MANYTKATNFATKDALLTGNPAKIIKGTEIDDEFNAIAVAIQTKADLVSPTFTGTPLAPTAVAGTNTTQIATTAFVTAADTAAITAERSATATLTNKTINLANNTLTATSAQVAAAVTDETGSGALVFANSPSLTSPAMSGTPTAPTAAAGTNTTQIATTAFVAAADTAERTATATLTNKTLTSPTINGGTISGITDLAVTDGGTGASDASGARTNLDVPSRSGADATGTWGINITGTAATSTSQLGYNQTLQDVKSSRSTGVTYTNSTGKPIVVYVVFASAVNNGIGYVNGSEVAVTTNTGNFQFQQITLIVPDGMTYQIEAQGSVTIYNWFEIR